MRERDQEEEEGGGAIWHIWGDKQLRKDLRCSVFNAVLYVQEWPQYKQQQDRDNEYQIMT